MGRRLILGIIWIGFTAYTLWLAPIDQPYTWWVGKKLLTLQWHELNAIIPAIFWLMGIWSMIYGCLMLSDGRMQNFRAWPYFVGSNFTGVMCLLPYLIFRGSNQPFAGPKDPVLNFFDRRSTGWMLLILTIVLLAYGVLLGDWQDYMQQFQTRAFVHLISLDFCTMAVIFPLSSLCRDDMTRRGLHNQFLLGLVSWVPLFGPLFYLCFRPPLVTSGESQGTDEFPSDRLTNRQGSRTPSAM